MTHDQVSYQLVSLPGLKANADAGGEPRELQTVSLLLDRLRPMIASIEKLTVGLAAFDLVMLLFVRGCSCIARCLRLASNPKSRLAENMCSTQSSISRTAY